MGTGEDVDDCRELSLRVVNVARSLPDVEGVTRLDANHGTAVGTPVDCRTTQVVAGHGSDRRRDGSTAVPTARRLSGRPEDADPTLEERTDSTKGHPFTTNTVPTYYVFSRDGPTTGVTGMRV